VPEMQRPLPQDESEDRQVQREPNAGYRRGRAPNESAMMAPVVPWVASGTASAAPDTPQGFLAPRTSDRL
jgi:hypothetical protein